MLSLTQEKGLWILVDTSASMTTIQSSGDRMAAAKREVKALLDKLGQEEEPWCFGLATFDQALVVHEYDTSASRIGNMLEALTPRALGTDLTLIRALANQLATPKEDVCPASYMVVVTDMPAPDWIAGPDAAAEFVWQDIGEPVTNVGISGMRWSGVPKIGTSKSIEIELVSYGDSPETSTATVRGPDGKEIVRQSIDWNEVGTKRVVFEPALAGEYSIELEPGGAYFYDDRAQITAAPSDHVTVDWQLADRAIPDMLEWQQESSNPHLRVLPFPGSLGQTPTLLVGAGYGTSPADTRITYFVEANPLLADLNLDVAEILRIEGIELPDDSPLVPVMSGAFPEKDSPDRVWLATSDSPLAAFVPGLPILNGDQDLNAFSTTAFFNAVQWLLQGREMTPLYNLTTPDHPLPEDNRIALYPGEANTARLPLSFGEIVNIRPIETQSPGEAIWPKILALAVCLFSLDRLLVFWRRRWR